MALDDDAVEPEEHAAVRLARIHRRAERMVCAARQEIAELAHQVAAHLALEKVGDLARGALGGLERDIAGKTFGHHHIHGSLANVVALDEANILELRELPRATHLAGLAYLLAPFGLLHPDIEQPDGRPIEPEYHSRHGAAHGGEVDEVAGIGA